MCIISMVAICYHGPLKAVAQIPEDFMVRHDHRVGKTEEGSPGRLCPLTNVGIHTPKDQC